MLAKYSPSLSELTPLTELFETVIVSIQECNIERSVAKPSITYSDICVFRVRYS